MPAERGNCSGARFHRPLGQVRAPGAEAPPRWYKGNLHTHSLWSDGDDGYYRWGTMEGANDGILAIRMKSDVLIAPHHGSSESLTDEFVAAVAPAAVISSNDRTLSQKQVRFEKLIGPATLYRTHRSGAVTLTLHVDGGVHAMGA